jgi:Holliday junction resolvase RusA-like endonuclease
MDKIVLPLPPTDNRRLIPIVRKNPKPRSQKDKFIAVLIKAEGYREWEKRAATDWWFWKLNHPDFQPHTPSVKAQMAFDLFVYLPSNRSDIANYSKAVADFLGGGKEPRLFTDDHYVSLRLVLPVTVDKFNPRVEINPVPYIYGKGA